VDLWTTQRSVAHKLHNANNSSKRKRTNDVLSKPDKSECYRQIPGAIVRNPRTAARAVGHVAGHVQHARSATRRLSGALRCAAFESVAAADVARIAERVHVLHRRIILRTPEPARVIGHGMAGVVVLQLDHADVGSGVAIVDPRIEDRCARPVEHTITEAGRSRRRTITATRLLPRFRGEGWEGKRGRCCATGLPLSRPAYCARSSAG
jgi:hypothetical protein